MNSQDVKRIDIKEFREFGYLQEVNRRFFHPLGLALEVVVEDDGSEHLGGIWDYRDDPEGMVFVSEDIDQSKRERVSREWIVRLPERKSALGYMIQDE